MATTINNLGASPVFRPDSERESFHEKLKSLEIRWPEEVDRLCADEEQANFLADGFLPAKSIAIAGGDSAIGKSPLFYQLALCVASGTPFLGMPTRCGRVLYFDLENSISDSKKVRDALVRFLGLPNAPDNFLLSTEARDTFGLERLITEIRPDLVIIDSLRAFCPEITRDNAVAGAWLNKIRGISRKGDSAILLIHHLRKPGMDAPRVRLDEDCRVTDWLLDMEGPRAFTNQTDVRIAIAEGDESAALRMKWSLRIIGDSPLMAIERVCDDSGEPAGYLQRVGIDLLPADKRDAFSRLPDEFTFKEAKTFLGRSDDPTNKFLKACQQLGLTEKFGKGRYRKKLTPPRR